MRDPERIRGVNRIEITPGEGHSYLAYRPSDERLAMVVDEPPEHGGSGLGASPLAHFLAGIGTCLLNQFIRINFAQRQRLEFVKMTVGGTITATLVAVSRTSRRSCTPQARWTKRASSRR